MGPREKRFDADAQLGQLFLLTLELLLHFRALLSQLLPATFHLFRAALQPQKFLDGEARELLLVAVDCKGNILLEALHLGRQMLRCLAALLLLRRDRLETSSLANELGLGLTKVLFQEERSILDRVDHSVSVGLFNVVMRDDYVTKPFSIRELTARVDALVRRTSGRSEKSFRFGEWTVEPAKLQATQGGESCELTPRELDLVALFVSEKGRVVSRRVLLKEVWEMAKVDEVETRTVDMHIAKLRKKLDPDGRLILTVRGAGYRYRG